MSVKLLSSILEPEMASPILCAPGRNASVLQEKTHAHKIPHFRVGGILGFWGGVPILFYGREDVHLIKRHATSVAVVVTACTEERQTSHPKQPSAASGELWFLLAQRMHPLT